MMRWGLVEEEVAAYSFKVGLVDLNAYHAESSDRYTDVILQTHERHATEGAWAVTVLEEGPLIEAYLT